MNSDQPDKKFSSIDFPSPALMSAATLASYLAVSENSIWNMRSSGRLPPAFKLGRCTRWLKSDIDEWIRLGMPNIFQWIKLKNPKKKNE